ncbi:hypothetical protein DFS33DRAFT_1380958 [Desarmillaria ectypa]|nr:hypothetical protein DFS33DRAFT_1380958 [Desarmillaria ectypa]
MREEVKKEEVDDPSILESVENSELPTVKGETDLEHRVFTEFSGPPILHLPALGEDSQTVIQLADVALRLSAPPDSLLCSGIDSRSSSMSSPCKRRRVMRVVVPILRFALDKLPARICKEGDNSEAMQRLVNPKIKKMKNLELSLDTVQNRIKGMRVYGVHLDPNIRDCAVDRRFMSQFWGGNTQETFPNIAQKSLDIHPQFEHEPACSASAWGTWAILFFSNGKWQYMGQYKMERAAPLTVEEWKKQEHVVVLTWAHKMSKSGYGTRCKVIVHLRHQFGRKPIKSGINHALQGGKRYKNVTKEQMAHALRQGWLVLGVWKMKCVGYDVAFQRDLVERWVDLVPPPPKPAKNQGTPPTGSKRKRKQPLDVVDSDDEFAVEELVYLSKGTKTHPIVV